ncbi:metalloprotease [Polymorphobacter glacialis]|uniref:Metalloprotease n=1 Tax=Sandarakinorhabdus glacialis TaxID=1614636 RepID=A0A917EA52_9SPHN|nr:M48 family metalloprotease [Polymorphobacter glacialis]GGE18513.1 metalloprotease [Polymorphobacter glacialis]
MHPITPHIALLLAATAAIFAVGASAQAPGFSAAERAEGAKVNPQLIAEFGGVYPGPQSAYVRAVGQRIAAQSGLAANPRDYTVTLLNSNVNNAFAIPGGYVYVSRQLVALMNDEAELAFVLGHEIGHVAAQHGRKRERASGLASVLAGLAGAISGSNIVGSLAGAGAQAYTLGYSRDQEREADSLGVRYLSRAGYDPFASGDILAELGAQTSLEARLAGRNDKQVGWLSTHPANAERVARIRREAAKVATTGQRATNRDAFLNAIDGMAYDDDPAQGIIEGRSFRHGPLGIAFDAPAGFTMQNSPAAVIGIKPGAGQFQFAGGTAPDIESYSAKVWQAAGATAPQPRATTVNGIEARVSQAHVESRNGTVDATLAVYRWGPDRYYHLLMLAPGGSAATFEPMVTSVRRLTPVQAGAIRGRRVDVVTVKPGDTIASMAARMAYADNQVARFTILNGLEADDRLQPGTRVKLIVRG